MALIPHLEPLIGAVNGVNTVFLATTPYEAGTFTVIVRGLPRVAANDDGFFETNPATGIVTLKEAPLLGDDVLGFWLENIPGVAEVEVSPLKGAISSDDGVSGAVAPAALAGGIAAAGAISGQVADEDIAGGLGDAVHLTGKIKEC